MSSNLELDRRIKHLTHHHSAYVLWLLKHGICKSFHDLCVHFRGCDDFPRHIRRFVADSLGELLTLGFVEAHDPNGVPLTLATASEVLSQIMDESFVRDTPTVDNDTIYHVTSRWERVQAGLGIKLTTIASFVPEMSDVVNPVFGPPAKHRAIADVFVAMPFSEEMLPIYEDHIKPTVLSTELTCARGDATFTDKSVITDIWHGIRNARCFIADCTGRNPNVFYEIGIAHTVGVPTILMTQQHKDDVPFDVRHMRRIEYAYTPPGTLLAKLGREPRCPKAYSGKGDPHRFHLFFRHPHITTGAKYTPWHPKLEFRGHAGLVVLAPSVHKSGNRYRWAEGQSPDDLSLPEVPDLVLAELRQKYEPPVSQPDRRFLGNGSDIACLSPRTQDFLTGLYANKDGWNCRIFLAGCDCQAHGLPLETAQELILRGAQPRTREDERLAVATIESAYSKPREPSWY